MSEARTRTQPGAASAAVKPTTATITLDFPIDVGGVQTNRLTMRRPKVRDRLLLDQQYPGLTDAERELKLFANLCEVSSEDLEEMDMADYGKVARAFSGFTASAS